jgi:hypothetical protein
MVGARPEEGPAPEEARQRHSRETCPTLEGDWEAAERGGGQQEHATSLMPFESSMANTGDSSMDEKSSGEGVKGKRFTKARGQRGESEGAEESEHGKAVHNRLRTGGEGP